MGARFVTEKKSHFRKLSSAFSRQPMNRFLFWVQFWITRFMLKLILAPNSKLQNPAILLVEKFWKFFMKIFFRKLLKKHWLSWISLKMHCLRDLGNLNRPIWGPITWIFWNKFTEFLVTTDCELKMSGRNSFDFQVFWCISC